MNYHREDLEENPQQNISVLENSFTTNQIHAVPFDIENGPQTTNRDFELNVVVNADVNTETSANDVLLATNSQRNQIGLLFRSCSTKISKTMNFIYNNKFLSFLLFQMILIIAKMLGVISAQTEAFLTIFSFMILLVMGIVHCGQIVRRENETLQRFAQIYNAQTDVVNRNRLREHHMNMNLDPNHRAVNEIRLTELHNQLNQLRNISFLANRIQTNWRNQQTLQAVLRANGNPNIQLAQNDAQIRQILFTQHILSFLSDLTNVDIPNQNPGLTEEHINLFPLSSYHTTTIDGSEPEACTICLEEYKEGMEVRTLSCQHLFHKNCIDEWLKLRNNCPNCKRVFEASNSHGGIGPVINMRDDEAN
jgi:hypothetical protein